MQVKRAGNLVGIVMKINTKFQGYTYLARKENAEKYTYNFGLVNVG